MLCASAIIYGQDCINLEISDDCAENQTIIAATSETILFSAVGNWNQGEIDYQIRHGRDLLKMNVQASEDQFLIIVIYNNYRASLYMDPNSGMLYADNPAAFESINMAISSTFVQDMQDFVSQMQGSAGDSEVLIALHEALLNPRSESVPIGGIIKVGDMWGPGKYAICWYSCLAGCTSSGGKFDDCAMDCWDSCKFLLK